MFNRDAIQGLWAEHLAHAFPASAHDVDDPVPELLDTEIAGIVVTLLGGSSGLRADHRSWLRDAISDLDRLLPQMDQEAVGYFRRLRRLAVALLDGDDVPADDGRLDTWQMEAWLGEARAVLIELEDELTADEAAEIEHLIDHGEPAEGLLSLAWKLDNKDADTSPATRSRIRWLVGDLVEDDLWPSRWQSE